MAAIGLKLGQSIDLKDLRYGRILFYVDADCLEEETMILTKDGIKKISDINYDDEVLSHSGEYKNIKNIIEKDISNYIEISVNGNTFKCSPKHKLIVLRDGEVIEIEANDLKYTDHLLLKDKN
jgi:intein/homing endonuclease